MKIDGLEVVLTRHMKVMIDKEIKKRFEELKPFIENLYRWIPVEERLPDRSNWVIITGNGLVSVGCFDSVLWYAADDLRLPFEPTHWQPLPEPPASL